MPFAALCVDSSLGRVQPDMLSDQTLCELLISALDEDSQRRHQDKEGVFLDFEEFESIEINESGEAHEFRLISVSDKNYSGSLVSNYIPQTVCAVFIFATRMSGEVDFARFPPALESLTLKMSLFCGSAALEDLPASVKSVDISSNRFTGTIAFESLPPKMESLRVLNNAFHGTVAFRCLPKTLVALNLALNKFTGEVPTDTLPPAMQSLSIFHNDFSGKLDLRSTAPALTVQTKHPGRMLIPRNPVVDKKIFYNKDLEIIEKDAV